MLVEEVPAMKRVFSGRNEVEAHFVRNALEAEGIQAVVQGETLAAGAVPLLAESMPAVYVPDEDAGRAETLVRSLPKQTEDEADQELDRPSAAGTWTCPKCGETIDGQFDACWKCGTDKEAAAGSPPPPDAA